MYQHCQGGYIFNAISFVCLSAGLYKKNTKWISHKTRWKDGEPAKEEPSQVWPGSKIFLVFFKIVRWGIFQHYQSFFH